MTLSPDRTLLRWAFVWFVLGVASVPLVALRPLVPVAGLLLAAIVLADAWLSLREAPLELARIVPAKAARASEVEVVLTLSNPLGRKIEADVRESVPKDLVEAEPVWQSVLIEPVTERRLRYLVRPRVRGRRSFGDAIAMLKSPFGLLRRRVILPDKSSILVHPESDRFLRPEAIDPKSVLASLGVRPRRRRGDGTDFDQLRDYVIGDEPRRIDWRATARRGRPIVRTHRHEESRTVLLAVDCSRLMGARAPSAQQDDAERAAESVQGDRFASTKLDFAVDAALALAFASLAAGDRVGLIVFDRGIRQMIAPVSGRANLGLFVDALSSVQPSPVEADYRRLSREMLGRQRKRAMLVVLTDFIEVEREELILPMGLLSRRHEVVFAALREPVLDGLDEDPLRMDSGPTRDGTHRLFRRIVLADLMREREGRLLMLRREGLSVLDVRPADATASTLNRFLELRYGAA